MKLKKKDKALTSIVFLPLAMGLVTAAYADTPIKSKNRFLSIVSENDNYVPPRDDRHYTSGFRLSYGFDVNQSSPWRDWLGALSTLNRNSRKQEYEIAVGQHLYTPAFFTFPGRILNDRPYAGWLYGELSVTTPLRGSEEAIAISVGVVGPAALGEETQKFIHSISGDPKPRGWQHQLQNEPALLVHYRRSWFMPLHQTQNYQIDLVPRFAFNLGNVVTELGIGSSIRLGSFLPQRDTPARMQPGLASSSSRFQSRPGRTDWLLHGGILGRAVGHNIFLDGNTYQNSLSVDKKEFVWDATLGFTVTFGRLSKPVALSFTHVWRSKEFERQREMDKFGSIQLSLQF